MPNHHRPKKVHRKARHSTSSNDDTEDEEELPLSPPLTPVRNIPPGLRPGYNPFGPPRIPDQRRDRYTTSKSNKISRTHTHSSAEPKLRKLKKLLVQAIELCLPDTEGGTGSDSGEGYEEEGDGKMEWKHEEQILIPQRCEVVWTYGGSEPDTRQTTASRENTASEVVQRTLPILNSPVEVVGETQVPKKTCVPFIEGFKCGTVCGTVQLDGTPFWTEGHVHDADQHVPERPDARDRGMSVSTLGDIS